MAEEKRARKSPVAMALMLVLASGATWGQEPAVEKRWRIAVEAKAHLRSSDDVVLGTRFANPVKPQENVRLRTVDPGDHLEASALTLFVDVALDAADRIHAHTRIDLIDRYDRNPTATGDELDVDEAWVRFGREVEPGELPEGRGVYLKIGKFPKFERQDDRHLESYGLLSTAFNRQEDVGLELGVDLSRHLYLKLQATQGNPVFFRDPTALAGDNGTPETLDPQRGPRHGSGLAIVYDADVQGFDLDQPELGAGLGLRFGDAAGNRAADLLLWGYRRNLAESVPIEGSFYGGDLDFLRGPFNRFPFPVSGDDKREVGANLWLYWGGFSFFGQYVDQDLAGLERSGFEGELAWRFELPLLWAAGGKQLLSAIQPAVRFSRLDPDFPIPAVTPSPSFGWTWEKLDVGLRLTLWGGVDLTVEHARNQFVVRGR
ncbi:MAG: hypothetical protein D6696_16850, partial [Acidobacteria bacterium]